MTYIFEGNASCSLVVFTPVLCTTCVHLSVYICLICVLVWRIIRVSCTISGPPIIMTTSYLRRHWLIPVLHNFLFFNLLLKSLIFSRKLWVLVSMFSARQWRERRILHHLLQSFWGPWAAPRLPAVRPPLRGGRGSKVTLSQICVHFILG